MLSTGHGPHALLEGLPINRGGLERPEGEHANVTDLRSFGGTASREDRQDCCDS